jgi:PAS domain S-box-containing protein
VAESLEREDDRLVVEHAEGAEEGLTRLEEEVDCIVSEYNMSGLDGIEFLEAVRDRRPDVPFILYTGKGSEAVASDAISAGVTDYLQKEAGINQYAVLANRITTAVERYRVRPERKRREERQRPRWDALFDLMTDGAVIAGDIETALERITETAADVLGVGRVTVWLFDDAGDRLRCIDNYDRRAGRHERGTEFAADCYPAYFEALESSRSVTTADPVTDPRTAGLESYLEANGVQSVLDATIRTEGDVVGVIRHEHLDGRREWTADEIEFACDVTELVHRVLRNRERAERRRELERSRARFRALTENTAHAVVTIDDESVVRYANDAVEELFGHEPAELIGESLRTIMPERYHEDYMAGMSRYLGTGSRNSDRDWVELTGKHRDGSEFPVAISFGEAVVDGDLRFTAVIRDIRERKAHSRELEAARRRFDAVFNNPIAFMGLLDPDGTVIDVNEAALEFVDREPDDVRGEPFWDTPWWDHSEELQARLRRWIDRAADGELVRYESDHYASDGEHAAIDGVLHPIREDDGAVVSLLAAGRDISERKERERAINALHDATRELIGAGSPEVIAELIAASASELLGLAHTGIHLYDEETERLEAVAWTDTVDETIGEPPALDCESLAWEAFDAGETRVYDDFEAVGDVHNPDTPLRSELIVPLGRHGVVIAAAEERGAFDRNDRRLGELLAGNATAALDRLTREERLRARERELERKNDRLEELASVLSHDLRNPLNVAMGRLEIVAENRENEHLDAVESALERMQALIENLLTLASEEAPVTDREAISLSAVARESWQNVETDGASLRVAGDRTLRANESRLKQLFENLYRNALEHGTDGGPSDLDVTVGSLDDGFYLEDDGPGILPDARESVLDAGYSTSADGTGFGLSIVRQVAEAHGWELRVTEGSDGGARFEVTEVEAVSQ